MKELKKIKMKMNNMQKKDDENIEENNIQNDRNYINEG